METTQLNFPPLHFSPPELSHQTLSLLGMLGLTVEYLIPSLPFGLLTSSCLAGMILIQHHWTKENSTFQKKLQWSTIGLISSAVCTALSSVFYLDILRGQEGTDVIAWLPITTWILSIFAVLGSTTLVKQKREQFNWIFIGMESLTCAGVKLIMNCFHLKPLNTSRFKLPIRGILINGFMPIMAILLFIRIYTGINPSFGQSTEFLFEGVYWMMEQWSILLTSLPYTKIVVSMLILGMTFSTFTGSFNLPEIMVGNGTIPAQDNGKHVAVGYPNPTHNIDIIDELDELDAMEAKKAKEAKKTHVSTSKKWDIETLTPTLIALNALLLWFHCIDLYSIVSSDLSSPVVLSQNVHACLSRVFLATTSAIAILLLPTTEVHSKSHQQWAKAWIVNNGIFSIWAILKVGLYIGLCGVTTKRLAILGVFIGLAWTVKSCFSMLNKKNRGLWIFNKGIELQYVCIVASCIAATLFGIIRLF